MPALNSGHTVGHIATPDLVWFCYGKLSGKNIRDFNMLITTAFVFMPWYLTTGDTQFLH